MPLTAILAAHAFLVQTLK